MKYRELSKTGVKLSAIGLGCMGMSMAYGPKDDNESIKVMEKALDLGINFWDTADIYGAGHNESLISKVLSTNRNKIFIASKFGFRPRTETNHSTASPETYVDVSPAYMKQAVEKSLQRLKIETIDLYYAHRIDPTVPVEEMIAAMAGLVKEGKVRYLGLSEASAASIRKAYSVHPIAALQSEYSLLTRDVEQNEILATVRELGISFIPFSPLARGLVTATVSSKDSLAADDFRRTLPRFDDRYWKNNISLATAFAGFASTKNCTAAQLALAWVLAQGDDIIPIPGTKKIKYLEENAAAVNISLSPGDLLETETILKAHPDTGERYNEGAMKMVNH